MSKIKYKHTSEIHNTKDALEILPFFFDYLAPKSILDIGCGNGSWLKVAEELGVQEILGIDGILLGENELLIPKDAIIQHDLTTPLRLKKTFDLVLSLEVAEHLPESLSEVFIESLCRHGDVVLFSAAIPNQGGQNHINEQWPEYWHQKFKAHGFLAYDILRQEFWDNSQVFWWYSQNMIVYAKANVFQNQNVQPVEKVNGLVHPESYKRKINHPRYIKTSKEYFRLMAVTLKWFIKNNINRN